MEYYNLLSLPWDVPLSLSGEVASAILVSITFNLASPPDGVRLGKLETVDIGV